jgi:hypothetical protein
MPDAEKAAQWEALIEGPNGLAMKAHKIGLASNPEEAAKRQAQGRMPGEMQRRAYGLEEILRSIKGEK